MRRTRRRETARRLPFLFDTARARQLLEAAAALPDNPRATGRGPTYHAIFVLCYGLGLRAGEACGLRLGDVDADRQLLVVRGGKFGKSRLVPHGPRIGRAPRPTRSSADGSGRGRTRRAAVQLRRSAQRAPAAARARPSTDSSSSSPSRSPTASHRRICTACATRSRWGACCAGIARVVDPSTRLYQLSTFMGHVDPASTAVYLTITPELLAEANRRFEAFAEPAWSAGEAMTGTRPLGPLIHSFFLDHLVTVKGLRPASVRSYRDTIRLLLCFVAEQKRTKITKLGLEDLSFERVLGFLRYLEHDRDNHVRTRNQRLAALHTLFDYIASREPEMLGICQQVAAIPMKRAAPAETHFLERDEVEALLRAPAPHRPPRPARPRPAAVPLQHRGAGAGGRRPAGRTPRARRGPPSSVSTARATNGGPARYGARPHSCWPSCSTRRTRPPTARRTRLLLRDRPGR